jgi:hypothetical protein
MNIFNDYTPSEIRRIFLQDTNSWPEDFCRHVNNELKDDLLDNWLEQHSDSEYREKIKDIVEHITYGYEDDNNNTLLEFDV